MFRPLKSPDGQLLVRLGRVEMIDRVTEAVGIGIQMRGRIDGQVETDQPLTRCLLRLHPQLHDALAHRRGVAELGAVSDFQQHQAGSLCSIG